MKNFFLIMALFFVISIGASVATEVDVTNDNGFLCREQTSRTIAYGIATNIYQDNFSVWINCNGTQGICWVIMGNTLKIFTGPSGGPENRGWWIDRL
jgi:hypothetical protein